MDFAHKVRARVARRPAQSAVRPRRSQASRYPAQKAQQALSIWEWLLNPAGLSPHGFCLSWAPGLVAVHAISDAVIALSYFAIPVSLAWFGRERTDFQYRSIIYLFAAFILACGATHLFSILTLWVPVYGIEGLVKVLTALLSLGTAVVLWPLVPRLLLLPSPSQLRDLNLELSARIAAQEASAALLRESEARFRLIAEYSGDVIVLSDVEGILLYVSPAAERVLGWRPEDMIGRHATRFIHSEDIPIVRNVIDAFAAGASEQSAYFRHLRPDGSWLWVDSRARSHGSAEAEFPKGKVVVLRDATETKAAEAKLRDALERMERMAATDELTGLANRRRFNFVADIEWRRCARERLPLSVLLLDADHFKLFNDRYGHQAGDDCLRAIASQLDRVARRPGDVAARYGGEEFVLLMPNTDESGALHVANRLRGLVHGLGIVHAANAAHGVVTVSIGAATARPGDTVNAFPNFNALLNAADAAVYRAKREGRNRVCGAMADDEWAGVPDSVS